MIKRISLSFLIISCTGAGINHLLHPDFYAVIIPSYLPYHSFINYSRGIVEIFFGILFIFSNSRTRAVDRLIILPALFIPAHIFMIQKAGCMSAAMCIPAWVALLRLGFLAIYIDVVGLVAQEIKIQYVTACIIKTKSTYTK